VRMWVLMSDCDGARPRCEGDLAPVSAGKDSSWVNAAAVFLDMAAEMSLVLVSVIWSGVIPLLLEDLTLEGSFRNFLRSRFSFFLW